MQRDERSRGQVVVLIALMLPVLLAMVGLVVDLGMMFSERRAAQNAADAAALAAAGEIALGFDPAAARTTALYYAAQNGYDNDGSANTVAVSIPPDTGPSEAVQVQVSRTMSTSFMRVVGLRTTTVAASATAAHTGVPSPHTVLVLNPIACPAMSLSGSGHITTGGSLMVNSNCTSYAFISEASGRVRASWIGVSGGASYRRGLTNPAPTTGVPPAPDPISSLSPPSFSGMPVQHGSPDSPSTLALGSSPVTLYPGVYYGGITVGSSGNVRLEPGIYIIAGGGFGSSGNSTVTGNDVFIYNTHDPANPSGAGAHGSINITGSGTVWLTPMTTGPYRNLLFFQDRGNTQPFTVTGSGSLTVAGTIYVPSATATYAGSGSVRAVQIISDRATVSASADLTIPWSPESFYAPPTVKLVQ